MGLTLTGPADAALSADAIRSRHLERLHVLTDTRERRFDRITELATAVFGVPFSSVTLLDGDQALLKSIMGMDALWVPRQDTFCTHTISAGQPVVVEDATADPRFATLPAVTGAPYLRFYAGIPLADDTGVVIGSFCLYDTVPRRLDITQWQTLLQMASWVQQELVDSEEMKRARRVQESLLPVQAPVVDGYSIAGMCLPTKSVGGDFFDYGLYANRLAFGLFDVMGKGTGSALVAATVRALLHATISEVAIGVGGRKPETLDRPIRGGVGGVLRDVDRLARRDLERTQTLVTGFFCEILPESGVTRWADAGHGLSVLVRADGSAHWLRSTDLPIGVVDDAEWTEHETALEPGDTVLTVSDGLFDLLGSDSAAELRIVELVRRHPDADDLVAAVADLACASTALDDVTAVAVHRRSEGSS